MAAWLAALQTGNAPSTLREIGGDFAVAVRLPDDKVILAVDRFAVRTLCYRQVGTTLQFAERADAFSDPAPEIDPQAIFDYLYFHAIPSPRTIFAGVKRVPPGHFVVFDHGQVQCSAYWNPDFTEGTGKNLDTLKAEFVGLLEQATCRQLDGSKPACFLSGGTDSSTVAGMIGRVSGRVTSTYSIGFDAAGYDEMAFARIAAKAFGTDHNEYYVTPADLVRSIPGVASHYDQPFGNSSALPAFYCAKMAKEDGVTRILAGDGGDELFGGNSRYARQRIFNWYRHFPGLLRKGLVEPLVRTGIPGGLPLLSKVSSYVEQASMPMPDRLQLYNLVVRLGIDQVLSTQFLSRIDGGAPLAQQREVWKATPPCTDTNRELAYDWRFTLAESDLPKVCGTTRLAGVEVGFPMLDDDLLAFSLRLPTDLKLKGLKLRWFFKEALRGFLPDEIITKRKQGFGLPFGVWLTREESLMKLARESVFGLAERGILRQEFTRNLLDTRLHEHPGYYGEMVWISMMMEQWLRAQAPNFSVAG